MHLLVFKDHNLSGIVKKYKQPGSLMGKAIKLLLDGDRITLDGWDFVDKTKKEERKSYKEWVRVYETKYMKAIEMLMQCSRKKHADVSDVNALLGYAHSRLYEFKLAIRYYAMAIMKEMGKNINLILEIRDTADAYARRIKSIEAGIIKE